MIIFPCLLNVSELKHVSTTPPCNCCGQPVTSTAENINTSISREKFYSLAWPPRARSGVRSPSQQPEQGNAVPLGLASERSLL